MQLTKSDISKLVKVRKSDVFWNHFFYSLKKDYKVYGDIQKNTIKIWQKGNMTGAFYAVYTFEFNSKNHLIKTTDKLNVYGKLLRLLFPFAYFFHILSTALTDFEFKRFFIGISIFLILVLAFILLSDKIYQFEKKEQLNDFYTKLNIKTEEELEREWSRNQILTRLFLYPFCFALILFNILALIEGEFSFVIPTIGFVGIYLYSDLKMIFKYGNSKNKTIMPK